MGAARGDDSGRFMAAPEGVLNFAPTRPAGREEKVGCCIQALAGIVRAGARGRERPRKDYGALGALIGLFCTEWVGRHALGGANPWFIAPMGASAVLLFAAPASPLAQPWSIMAGNLVSALIGVTCARAIPDPGLPPPPARWPSPPCSRCAACIRPAARWR